MPYYGYGPRKRTNIRNITLGATMAQAKVVGFQKAKLCSGSYDYDNTFKATVTLDVTTSGCSTEAEDPCATDPDAKFDVTIDFTLPKDATGVSGSNMADPGRRVMTISSFSVLSRSLVNRRNKRSCLAMKPTASGIPQTPSLGADPIIQTIAIDLDSNRPSRYTVFLIRANNKVSSRRPTSSTPKPVEHRCAKRL